jgi:hypothetical protein
MSQDKEMEEQDEVLEKMGKEIFAVEQNRINERCQLITCRRL